MERKWRKMSKSRVRTSVCVQCEIKLIRCDNETEIIYGYKVMLVCLFFSCRCYCCCRFFICFPCSFFCFQVFGLYPYIWICIQEDKTIECAEGERKDRIKHNYVKQRAEEKQPSGKKGNHLHSVKSAIEIKFN